MGRASADAVRFYYVYILVCFDGKPYTGCTDNLKDRFERHQKGQVPATKDRLPVALSSYYAFSNKYTAFNLRNISNQVQAEVF